MGNIDEEKQTRGRVRSRPIMLSGVYRSATTYLTAVVNNLPNVAAASSTVKFLQFCLSRYGDPSHRENFERLLSDTAARISKRWNLALDAAAVAESVSLNDRDYPHAYDAIMRQLLLQNTQATRWAEKLAAQWRDIPIFFDLFPNGQVIHVIRDPRDTTASYKAMTYEPWPTFMDAAINCAAAMRELPELQERFGKEKILIVRAEDLSNKLAAEMARICAFLDEPFDVKLTDFTKFSDIKEEHWRTNTSFKDNKPISQSIVQVGESFYCGRGVPG